MFWILIGLITAAVAWYFMKQRGAPDAAVPASADTPAAPKPAWGKRVVSPAGATCCNAARAIEGTRYTNDALPMLPLPDCTNKFGCLCHFETIAERRSQKERRSGVERRPNMRYDMNKTQRRSGTDRRSENFNPFN